MANFKLTCLAMALGFSAGALATEQNAEKNAEKTTDSKSLALDPQAENTEVISILGHRNQANTEPTEETLKLLKIAGIDNDPLSAVFSLPGVVYAGGDDGGEPAIRGSSPDDNAFYIDGRPAGYIFHLFGDSIFNKNLVRDFSLHPAAFGNQYGNATGGVFDVTLRDPKNQPLTTTIDMSLLKSAVMLEGGVTDEQAFYFSYRRSNIHLFLSEGEEDEGYTLFKAPISDDYQGKYQWLIGDSHKLTFDISGASDVGGINISAASEDGRVDPDLIGDLELKTRFDSQGISWQYFGENESLFSLNLSHLTEKERESYGKGQFVDVTGEEYTLRGLYQFYWLDDNKLSLGADFSHFKADYSYDMIPYYCTEHEADCANKKGPRTQDADEFISKTAAVYISNLWQINKSLALDLGLRAENNDYTDQSFVHPRASLTWYPTTELSVIAKAGSYSRFPDIETVLPKLGNRNIESPEAKHYSLAFAYDLNMDWNFSIDFYHKDFSELALSTEFGAVNEDLHYTSDLSGNADGVELVLTKNLSDGWHGWVSLSWSESERTNDLTGVTTEYYLDTPLLANMVANYQLNDRWDFGLRFTLRSGARYTPITGLRDNPDHPGHYLANYGELNAETLPVYHRLDLQANYKSSLFGQKAEWTFAMINALGRKNVSGYYYKPEDGDSPEKFNIEGEEGMGIYPSVGVKVEF